MIKSLNDLSPSELGQLFPVEIVPYKCDWHELFLKEKTGIERIISPFALKIEHFGSTAIPSIASKPVIDILVAIPDPEEIKLQITEKMRKNGYNYIPRNDSPPPYMMFVKGYIPEGFKGQCYHIHMAPLSHTGLWDRIYFRDYLISNPTVAKEYEALKLELALKYKNDREAYTDGKSEFVKRITVIAKKSRQI